MQAGKADGLPSEAALARQPSVAAAVHQALPDMPVPPQATPLSDSSGGSRDLALPDGPSLLESPGSVESDRASVRFPHAQEIPQDYLLHSFCCIPCAD